MSDNYHIRSETNGRENNEDSFLVFSLSPVLGQPVVILAVADGMGGHAHGEDISREALRKVGLSLVEQLSLEPALNHLDALAPASPTRVAEVMWGAIQQTNHHVQRMIENNHWEKAGSTIVLAALIGQMAVVANLGDSPLFHYRAVGNRLTRVTEDHTVAGALLRAGMITPTMARHHEGRSRLEYFLGVERLPAEPTTRQVILNPDDLLLLCSDGVSGSLTQKQIESILAARDEPLAALAERLIQAAQAAGETDNQTVILWQQPSQPPDVLARSAFKTEVVPPGSITTLFAGEQKGKRS